MRRQYWSMMTQKKFSLFYLGYHIQLCGRIERGLDIILAIISTGSLAGLFISNEHQRVLAIILAIAQIITAARPYLPFSTRLKELEKGLPMLNLVYMEIEKEWNEANLLNIEDTELNKIRYRLQKKWDDVDNEILTKDTLPQIKKFREKAMEENDLYFDNMFGGSNE